ncbi:MULTISPECIES: class I SAM-dependent methyltransferase [Pseudofrankia]|uniref:class I SAM-dependent methyltransferase n=1 Tax=Pseudofrankia TaxID=2994363 RepID=UPI000234D118|nr:MULTISPECIES: methyltransferase domain-containing protein [Pseudofrankia]OHV37445.1 methyltransferase type 11 [Pseudofrankia sp. EUN1h]
MLSGRGADSELGDPEYRRPLAPTVVCEAPAGSDDPYWSFYDEVASVQLREWLPGAPSRVLDVSGQRDRFARQMVAAGHQVVRVLGDTTQVTNLPADPSDYRPLRSLISQQASQRTGGRPGALRSVVGDARSLDWFAPASFDAVLAEGRALSFCLATESTLEEIHRLLRPGGQLLLCVDSLLLGLARLAEQHRWAELSDVPRADVVLVPAEDGTITRCFWPEELKAVLTSAGLEVDWVRPRTVLSVEAVKRALSADMSSFPTLVRTEVELAAEREGESIGIHLIASARRPS